MKIPHGGEEQVFRYITSILVPPHVFIVPFSFCINPVFRKAKVMFMRISSRIRNISWRSLDRPVDQWCRNDYEVRYLKLHQHLIFIIFVFIIYFM